MLLSLENCAGYERGFKKAGRLNQNFCLPNILCFLICALGCNSYFACHLLVGFAKWYGEHLILFNHFPLESLESTGCGARLLYPSVMFVVLYLLSVGFLLLYII